MAAAHTEKAAKLNWNDRVSEAEKELRFAVELERQLLEELKALDKEILKTKEIVRQEKLKLATRLDETENIGRALEAQCVQQSDTKSKVEAVYQQTLDEYDRMHDVVKKVVAKEKEIDGRHDLEKTLQIESYQWAEEEHRLRTQIHALQHQQKAAAAKQQDELAAAEAKLRDAEARLHSDRMSREYPSSITGPSGRRSASRPTSRAGSSRAASTSLGRGVFTDESMVIHSSNARTALSSIPQPILMNKNATRKRDHLGDLTNLN